jgi:hypothetical protein
MPQNNEKKLRESIASLREYMGTISPIREDAASDAARMRNINQIPGQSAKAPAAAPAAPSFAQQIGQGLGKVANWATTPAREIAAGAQAIGGAVGNAASAVGKGVGQFATDISSGAQAGYSGTPAPAQSAKAAPLAPATSASAATSSDKAAVMKLQQDLIAKGAKINADGIMGPNTAAAQKQFGGATPDANPTDARLAQGTQATPQAAPVAAPAVNPTDARLAQGAQTAPQAAPVAPPAADGGPAPTPAQLKWLGGANPADTAILARMRSAVPNAVQESVNFRSDELTRLVSLVQHR